MRLKKCIQRWLMCGLFVWLAGFSFSAHAQTPTAPSNLVAVAVSTNQNNLSWIDRSSIETGFKIERAPDVAGSPGTWTQIATVGANATTYTNAGLSANTKYWYRVRAYRGGNNSAYSNQANATTFGIGVLLVLPPDGLVSTGFVGGPFSPASQMYTLTNSGSGSLGWSTANSQSWLSLSTSGGTLAAGASMSVTASINSNANSLAAGSYSDNVLFTNLTNGFGTTNRPVSLMVVTTTLETGLVAYYPFNGDANDYSGNTNNGSVINATFQTTSPTGKMALRFAGNPNSYVLAPSITPTEPTNALSISMWCYGVPGQACGGGWGTILRKAGNCTAGYLIRGCNGRTSFTLAPPNPCSGGTATNATFPAFTGTNWQHIVGTYSAADGMLKSYEHGVLISQTPYTNLLQHTGSLYIGGANVASDDGGFDGLINEVRIYNRALSAEEVQQLYASGNATNLPPGLSVSPTNGFNSSGLQGGPFSPSSQIYSLTNTGSATFNWSASKGQNWVELSATNGSLLINSGTTVTVSINLDANALAAGAYTDTVNFTNLTTGVGSTRLSVSLIVNAPVAILGVSPVSGLVSTGFIGGPFAPSSQIYTLTNSGSAVMNWAAANNQSWLSLSATSGTLGVGESATVTVSINSNANTLTFGSHSDTVTFTNLTHGTGSTNFLVNLIVCDPDPNLSLSLSFDEGSGAFAYDSSGNGNTGIVVGATWTNGIFGSALYFNGNSYVSVTNSPTLNPTTNITLAAWIKPQTWDSNNRIMQKGAGDNQYRLLREWDIFTFNLAGVGTTFWPDPPYVPSTGEWHHVAGTYDGSMMKVYVDGQIKGQVSASGLIATTADSLFIGSKLATNPPPFNSDFIGIMDDIRIYSVALTSNQIAQLYERAGMSVTPAATLNSSGFEGGPFSPASQIYTLTNNTAAPVTWSASKSQAWLSVSATNGTLASGSSTNVTVSINSSANSLAFGSYADSVIFTNLTNGIGTTSRSVSLTVNGIAALSVSPAGGLNAAGPQGGPFAPSNQVYTLSNTGDVTLDWSATTSAAWVTLSASNGSLAVGGNTSIVASINFNANNLWAGSYADTIVFTNLNNGLGTTTRDVTLTVNPSALLSVTPATGLSSSGFVGGPFSPSSQVYALTNRGSAALNWSASNSQGWLSLSATSGILAVGASTNVTAFINPGASGLTYGTYSDTVLFTNLTNGNGTTNRSVSLVVFPLLDHFSFAVVASPQTPALPFTVTITARDITNGVFTSFTGTVVLSGTSSVGAVSITPTNSGTFTAGQWTGSVAVNSPITNMWLVANDGAGHTGTSIPFDVQIGPVDHFKWSAVSSPQGKDVPFPVTVTAQDAGNNTVTGFVGSVDFTAWANGSFNSVEGFESGVWPHTPWVLAQKAVGTLSTSYAHDGNYGLRDPDWMYGTDVQLGNAGDQLSWWIQTPSAAGQNAGRAYLGFGASSSGSWSFVAAPNSGLMVIQRNLRFSESSSVATTNQAWQTNKWYKAVVRYTSTNSVRCSLYDSDGVTLLNSLVFTNQPLQGSSSLAGGVAIRSFGGWSLDTIASGSGSPLAMTPTNSGNFVNGVWTGSLSVLEIATNVILVATDSSGHWGSSGQFDVLDTSVFRWQQWQMKYFGCTTCPQAAETADADGDGMSNLAEFQAGTDPTNSASAFRILEIAPLDEDMLVTWEAVGGKWYIVQTATNLTGGLSNSFYDLNPMIIAPGTNEYPLSVLHLGAVTKTPVRFYRVRLVP